MRVGAKAVECLSLLKEARAVHFYRDYPKVRLLTDHALSVLLCEPKSLMVGRRRH